MIILFFIAGALSGCGLVPLASHLALQEVPNCRQHYSGLLRVLVCLCNGALYALVYFALGWSTAGVVLCLFFSVLAVASLVDIGCQLVPKGILRLLLALVVASCILPEQLPLVDRVLGALAGGLPLLVIGRLTNGFGGGDVKLLAVCGFLLGWKPTVLALFLAVILAAAVGLALVRIQCKHMKTRIPFVPFLSAGLIVAALYGEKLIGYYLSLFQVSL